MHLELEFWSVKIITGHAIYNSCYNILTDESSLNIMEYSELVPQVSFQKN